eukprot:gnl/MRDRNA2_/MRDRNA2_69611_c0_seq3.p1 gnl/MRDRNA2_/MRDRNA2_69611_c0~~gnl/MRDRNA2_/MRDRNA2_69611_c0_seq3.p1  ORF type:complete len:150 (+),score=7.29 gnl/MRDRNA2_/MRDRNA2_69611_c0_seq3:325-774(+)
MRLFNHYKKEMDHVHVSALWISIGRFAQPPSKKGYSKSEGEILAPLVTYTEHFLEEGRLAARQISNVAYAAVRTGRGKTMGGLFKFLADAALQCMDDMSNQGLSNIAWAYAKRDAATQPDVWLHHHGYTSDHDAAIGMFGNHSSEKMRL